MTSSAPHLTQASTRTDLTDWGAQPDPVNGASMSSGLLLHKGKDNRPETGIWVCTPGHRRLTVPRDEFCHFVAGRATYHRDTGETVEVAPGTAVLFPAGWAGECIVHETIRNTYYLSDKEPGA